MKEPAAGGDRAAFMRTLAKRCGKFHGGLSRADKARRLADVYATLVDFSNAEHIAWVAKLHHAHRTGRDPRRLIVDDHPFMQDLVYAVSQTGLFDASAAAKSIMEDFHTTFPPACAEDEVSRAE